MLGRVVRKADLEKKAFELHSDENRMGPWKWPDDPTWQGKILYMYDSNNEGFSNWLRLKLKKAVSWETALRIMAGYKKDTKALFAKKTPEHEKYVAFNPNAVYETKGYSCSDGTQVDLTDKEALLARVGQNVWKEIPLKSTAGAE